MDFPLCFLLLPSNLPCHGSNLYGLLVKKTEGVLVSPLLVALACLNALLDGFESRPILGIALSKVDKPESQPYHVVLEKILPQGIPKGFRKAYAQTMNLLDRDDPGPHILLDWLCTHVSKK